MCIRISQSESHCNIIYIQGQGGSAGQADKVPFKKKVEFSPV